MIKTGDLKRWCSGQTVNPNSWFKKYRMKMISIQFHCSTLVHRNRSRSSRREINLINRKHKLIWKKSKKSRNRLRSKNRNRNKNKNKNKNKNRRMNVSRNSRLLEKQKIVIKYRTRSKRRSRNNRNTKYQKYLIIQQD